LLSFVRQLQRFLLGQLEALDERKSRAEQYQASRHAWMRSLRISSRNSLQLFAAGDPGVGTSGGVTFVLEDRAGRDGNFWQIT